MRSCHFLLVKLWIFSSNILRPSRTLEARERKKEEKNWARQAGFANRGAGNPQHMHATRGGPGDNEQGCVVAAPSAPSNYQMDPDKRHLGRHFFLHVLIL